MRAIWIRKHGGPEVLEVRDTPDPTPAKGEVRVRVKACGLNFAEVMARQGLYPDAPKPPCVVGYEGSGVVDALGAGVSGPAVGTRVIYLSFFKGHADVVCVPESQIIPIPDAMSFAEAAALPVTYLTAYHMLFNIGRLREGDHVLIHMAAGGVGTAALQLCRTIPNVTTYGTASAKKHDYLRAQGCTHPIDYKSQDYVTEVQRLSANKGVHFVLDALGGPDWKKGYSLLRPGGLLMAFGLANANTGGKRRLLHAAAQIAQMPWYSPMRLMDDNRGVLGVNVGHIWHETALLRGALDAVLVAYNEGKVKPHVGGSYPFARVAEAHAELEYGRNVGKIVLTPE